MDFDVFHGFQELTEHQFSPHLIHWQQGLVLDQTEHACSDPNNDVGGLCHDGKLCDVMVFGHLYRQDDCPEFCGMVVYGITLMKRRREVSESRNLK